MGGTEANIWSKLYKIKRGDLIKINFGDDDYNFLQPLKLRRCPSLYGLSPIPQASNIIYVVLSTRAFKNDLKIINVFPSGLIAKSRDYLIDWCLASDGTLRETETYSVIDQIDGVVKIGGISGSIIPRVAGDGTPPKTNEWLDSLICSKI